MPRPDVVAARIARIGDGLELHETETDRFGGRRVVATIERDGLGFLVKRLGRPDERRALLAQALAALDAADGNRDDWSFMAGGG